MKPPSLPDALQAGWIGPDALQPPRADLNLARVRAMLTEIKAGRYSPDCRVVADGVLSTIAPARRH